MNHCCFSGGSADEQGICHIFRDAGWFGLLAARRATNVMPATTTRYHLPCLLYQQPTACFAPSLLATLTITTFCSIQQSSVAWLCSFPWFHYLVNLNSACVTPLRTPFAPATGRQAYGLPAMPVFWQKHAQRSWAGWRLALSAASARPRGATLLVWLFCFGLDGLCLCVSPTSPAYMP